MQNLSNKEYNELVQRLSPASPVVTNCIKAFASGGAICVVGQALLMMWSAVGLSERSAAIAVSVTLVFLGALLTGVGVYDEMARFAGAGTLVPITGFANSVVSPALEFKTEGLITGTGAKMYQIAGPVITYGLAASIVYGLILLILGQA